MTEETIRAYFNKTATYESGKRIKGEIPEISLFTEMLTPGLVLDIGCGCGWFAGYFSQYVGVDISEKMLGLARKFNPTKSFVQAGATKLPFDANEFSGALACQVLPMLSYQNIVIASTEIFRVLKPNGYFLAIITEGKGAWDQGIGRDGTTHIQISRYSVESAIQMFENIGFECLKGSRYPEVSVLSLFLQKPA